MTTPIHDMAHPSPRGQLFADMLESMGDPCGWPTSGGPVNWETGEIRLRDRKGADPSEWPADLRRREYPR